MLSCSFGLSARQPHRDLPTVGTGMTPLVPVLHPGTLHRTCCHHWYMSQTVLTLLCGCCGAGQTDGPLSTASSCPNRIQALCSTEFIVLP